MFNRFNSNGTTPRTEALNHLLGSGIRYEGVVLSKEEKKKLDILYGYEEEKPQSKPKPPVEPNQKNFKTYYEYEDAVRVYKRDLNS